MKRPLTARQQQLLDYIVEHVRTRGHPPTIREIGRAFGFRSTGTARDHLHALETKGWLQTLRGKSRGLIPQTIPRGLSILGRVPAGSPLLADENIEGSVDLAREFGGKNIFALRVKGDSMTGAGIHDGDLVVVRAQDHAEAGQIVVAMVDGEATVKQLSRRAGKFWLQPANPRYEPIPVASETKIAGKVIGVIRSYERTFQALTR